MIAPAPECRDGTVEGEAPAVKPVRGQAGGVRNLTAAALPLANPLVLTAAC